MVSLSNCFKRFFTVLILSGALFLGVSTQSKAYFESYLNCDGPFIEDSTNLLECFTVLKGYRCHLKESNVDLLTRAEQVGGALLLCGLCVNTDSNFNLSIDPNNPLNYLVSCNDIPVNSTISPETEPTCDKIGTFDFSQGYNYWKCFLDF